MATTTSDEHQAPFRRFVESRSPFLPGISTHDAITHAHEATVRVPPLRMMKANWDSLLREPFKGITTDGIVRQGLFEKSEDNIPLHAIVQAAHGVLTVLTEQQRQAVSYPLDAKERRAWQNTHMYLYRQGIRLDEVDEKVQTAVLQLLETTMSPEGYQKAIIATETNAFLGKLYHGEGVLNKHSYNFALFGEPSSFRPWAFSFFGHHLCLNVFIYGSHIEITPTFMGAEPNLIDEGPLAGTQLFVEEQDLGLKLMQGLPPAFQQTARLRDTMEPDGGYKGPNTWAVAGAFQDNRIIPFEGVCLSEFPQSSKDLVLSIIEQFIIYLPFTARQRKMREIRKYIDETWFAWIGGFEGEEPFYYRLHSPVIICEFEHCASIFLGNTKPERFHTHTHVRTPNAGDYGYALLDAVDRTDMLA